MKKEINILRLTLLIFVGILVITGLLLLIFSINFVDYSELTEVSISHLTGFTSDYKEYTLACEDGQWIASQSKRFTEDAYKIVVDDAFVEKIRKLLAENKVHKWDGFNREYRFIYDASSFSFCMRFSDGKEIKASGYAAFPRNYSKVWNEFEKQYKIFLNE